MSGWAAIGGITGGVLEYYGQKETNRANARQARDQRDWEERMSNTAYQRSKADMLAAGINPILSVAPASTPQGVSANMQNPVDGDLVGSSVNSAMQSMKLKEELNNMRETNRNIASNTDLNNELKNKAKQDQALSATSAALNEALRKKANVDAITSANSAKRIAVGTALDETYLPQRTNQKNLDSSFYGKARNAVKDFLDIFRKGADSTSAYSNARDNFRGYNAQGVVHH